MTDSQEQRRRKIEENRCNSLRQYAHNGFQDESRLKKRYNDNPKGWSVYPGYKTSEGGAGKQRERNSKIASIESLEISQRLRKCDQNRNRFAG
jgi:hypothetical protein